MGEQTPDARMAFEYLASQLGKPARRELPTRTEFRIDGASWDHLIADPGTETWHPVFGFSHHFKSHDAWAGGYTANPWRGDHISIPGYTESGDIGVVEMSFHKGFTHMEYVSFTDPAPDCDFPGGWQQKQGAAYALLRENETR